MSEAKPFSTRGRVLGWALLLVALPVAMMGILHAPNEYRQTLGIDALDCDGPIQTYVFTVPAFVIYGAGLVLNGAKWRNLINLVIALLCLTICIALTVNIAIAMIEQRNQAQGCSVK